MQVNDTEEVVSKKKYDELKKHLHLILKATKEGAWDWHIDKGMISFSSKVNGILEYTDKPIPNFFDVPRNIVYEEDIAFFRKIIHKYTTENNDQPFEIEIRLYKKSGKVGWFRIRGVALWDDELKQVTRLTGTIFDITRRHEAEDELATERHMFRTLINNIPLHIYFKNLNSEFTLVNKSTAEALGKNFVSEVIGLSDKDFYDQEHSKQTYADEQNIINSKVPIIDKIEKETWKNPKREPTWVQTTKMPLFDKSGKLIGIFGVSADISKLIRIQNELKKTADELRKINQTMDQQLALARKIQTSFIPKKMPHFPESATKENAQVTFAYKYIPSEAFGGDFFEILAISDNEFGVFIGDVMGHGVRSALVVSILSGLIKMESQLRNKPQEFMQYINKHFHRIVNLTRTSTIFATGAYVYINLNEKTIHYVTAGHPKAIHINKSKGKIEFITFDDNQRQNQALGLFRGVSFPERKIKLQDNSSILLYTDGIHEQIISPKAEDTRQPMLKSIKKNIKLSSSKILDSIISDIRKEINDEEFEDDICLLTIDIK